MAKSNTGISSIGSRLLFYAASTLGVIAFAVVGVTLLVGSHAATLGYTQILNYQARSQTTGVTDVPMQINSLGEQMVSLVAPGEQLDYQVGGKTDISQECYLVEVSPHTDGGATATVEFTGPGRSVTRKLTYDPNQAGNFQKVCVPSGSKAPFAYNVNNKSPSTGPDILVYEDLISL